MDSFHSFQRRYLSAHNRSISLRDSYDENDRRHLPSSLSYVSTLDSYGPIRDLVIPSLYSFA
jgi:hypothetical protein